MTASKQTLIESAEKIIKRKGDCSKTKFSECKICPIQKDCCGEDEMIDTVEKAQKFLSENKPKTITKEELKIGQQVTFYSKLTGSDKTGKIEDFDIYTKHPVVNVGEFYRNVHQSISKLCPSFEEIKFVNGMKFVNESNNSQTTIPYSIYEKEITPSISQTNHTRLDKILDNINSLEKQKKVIVERIVESEKQLLCKKDDELMCEYVASDALFNITTEGSRLENIHLVRDFIDSLLKVEEV